MHTSPSSRLATLAKAARALGVPSEWLAAEALAGRLPHISAAGRFFFDLETIRPLVLDRARTVGNRKEAGR